MATQFIGEHLWPGQLGHFFIITSFVAALFSAYSFFRSAATENKHEAGSRAWLNMGRGGFFLHTASVIGIFSTLFYIIEKHLFEYHYAWEHSSLSLPPKFLLSCFWEGQEGSFMLWTFWHCVTGIVVMFTAGKLQSRVMAVISLVQVFLCTMILGIYFGHDIKVGSTPFILLRDAMQGAPIFSQPNYMNFIQDGNGLNVLLQNYWMVIHPPVLFLGFATTLIPFAYSIAALWKGEYKDFIKPTLAWSLFNGAVLGTGIMMGGAWAYESLNFGGYWAWDPVENASLVPWLVLIAGLHLLVVYRSTGRALTATLVFFLLTQLLVWYSTFLTRTGILGKTSVHAFTGDGEALYYHLLVVIGIMLALTIAMLVWRWRTLPVVKAEEETFTREFWMFIGSVVLFLAAFQIIFSTSLPVWSPLVKWMTGKEPAPPTDPMQSYNRVQVFVATIIGLLSGAGLYMKFRHTDLRVFGKRMGITAGIAAVMAALIGWGQRITTWQYDLMLFASCFAIVASTYYAITVQKAKLKKIGPSVSHLGFGMVLLGILLSSYNKHAISFNITGEKFGASSNNRINDIKDNMENEVLFRGLPMVMGDYMATYTGDSEVAGKDRRNYYKVLFVKKDSATHKVTERFMLYPDAFINTKGQQGLTPNPATQHFWDHDIYTFITGALDNNKTDTSAYHEYKVKKQGDTIRLSNGYLVFNGFTRDVGQRSFVPDSGDLPVMAKMAYYNRGEDSMYQKAGDIGPLYILRDKKYITYYDDTVPAFGLYVRFGSLDVKSQDSVSASILVRQTNPMDDFIVLKALVFPYINVLWLGIIVMVIGFFISLYKLLSKHKAAPVVAGGK